MFTASQIVAHLIGDYLLQSDWMAVEKTKRLRPALIHGIFYTLPFIFLMSFGWFWNAVAFLLIALSHALIDRYRLARYVGWAKNNIAPLFYNKQWDECKGTGYGPEKPAWMAVWLLIITDNTMHLVVNAVVLGVCGWVAAG